MLQQGNKSDLFIAGVQAIAFFMPTVVFLFGAIGSCSLALLLALFTDLFALLSLNITLSYITAAAILRFQLYAAYALFTLFRGSSVLLYRAVWMLIPFEGKRKNVLRARVDSWEYDIDQLILGTVLFTLVAFLMPTVAVYYAFFASVSRDTSTPPVSVMTGLQLRLCVLLAYAGMEVLLACVNYFPLFALMLRIKDPARLPGA